MQDAVTRERLRELAFVLLLLGVSIKKMISLTYLLDSHEQQKWPKSANGNKFRLTRAVAAVTSDEAGFHWN
ncbi:MAG: hypothetical protein RLZZ117_2666 [Cyanobacteriota bacterium]|jgi:hypothetical protein